MLARLKTRKGDLGKSYGKKKRKKEEEKKKTEKKKGKEKEKGISQARGKVDHTRRMCPND